MLLRLLLALLLYDDSSKVDVFCHFSDRLLALNSTSEDVVAVVEVTPVISLSINLG